MKAAGFVVTDEFYPVVAAGFSQVWTYLNYVDPYVLFTRGLSDVCISPDWAENTYEITKFIHHGARSILYEPDPEEVESYSINLGEGEWAFQEFLKSPTLVYMEALEQPKHFLHDIAITLQENVQQELDEVGLAELLLPHQEKALRAACSYRNEKGIKVLDIRRIELYFEFAAWASLVWVLSPLSRDWRCDHNELFDAVLNDGEALLIGHGVYTRGSYRKIPRPPQSCRQCGIQSWCLSNLLHGHSLALLCESCVTEGLPVLPPANCGTRLCRLPQCKHHPFNIFDPNMRLHETMRKTGQLLHTGERNPLLSGRTSSQNLLR